MTNPATIYEEWFVPALFAPLATQVLDRTEIPAGARVLDVACGSGIVARSIARRMGPTGRVVGIDANRAMLDAARHAAAQEGFAIDWHEARAEELPFEDETFDLVMCQQGVQFFPDRARALAEMHRVLVPGGRVVVVTWRGLDQNPFFATFDRAVRRRIASPALETPFSLGDPAALAVMLQEAGFGNVSVEPLAIEASYTQPDRFVELQVAASAAAIPDLQAMDATERTTLIAAIRDDLAQPVEEATYGDTLRFPMQGIVARGTRSS
jgi:ubiquinone/menaquinone biosynthesis C-methylase UbiE